VPRDWHVLVSPVDRRYQRYASPKTSLIGEREREREREREKGRSSKGVKKKTLVWHERNARVWIRRVTNDDTRTTAGPQHRAALRDRLGVLDCVTRRNR